MADSWQPALSGPLLHSRRRLVTGRVFPRHGRDDGQSGRHPPFTVLRWDSVQGDRARCVFSPRFGARITRQDDGVLVQPPVASNRLRGMRIDVSDIPDLVPAMAALCCRM